MVVERKLPVLANKGDTGRQILQMNIVTQDNITQQRMIAPKILEITTEINQNQANSNFMPSLVGGGSIIQGFNILQEDNLNIRIVKEPNLVTDNATTPSRAGSPTNMSDFVVVDVASKGDNMLINILPEDKLKPEPSFAGTIPSLVRAILKSNFKKKILVYKVFINFHF